MDWKALLGEKESYSLEDITKAVDGMKLIDLNEGGYVSKEKFDKLAATSKQQVGDLTAKMAELEKAGKPDEGMAGQLEELKAQLAKVTEAQTAAEARAVRLEREKVVSSKVTSPKLAKLALIEAESLVNEDTDFDAALAKVLEDPDYTAPADDGTPPVKVKSGEPPKGEPAKEDPALIAFEKALGVDDAKE